MNMVDKLGVLKAQIAQLEGEANEIANKLKDMGPGYYEGILFGATVVIAETARTDWKSVAQKLDPSPQLIAGNTTRSEVCTLRMSARKAA